MNGRPLNSPKTTRRPSTWLAMTSDQASSMGATVRPLDSPIQFRRDIFQSRADLPLQGEYGEAKLGGNGLEFVAVLLGLNQVARKTSNAVFYAARRWHGAENVSSNDFLMNTTSVDRTTQTGFGESPYLRVFAKYRLTGDGVA